MDWSELAKQVIGLGAPALGSALGGPLGGVAGKILAEALNAPAATPGAVQTSLSGADAAKLAEAEARWVEMIRTEAETQRSAITETNRTIRAELSSRDSVQRYWRPLYALELTFECAALWSVIVYDFWAGNVRTLEALMNANALLISYWGFRFGVLGVYVSGRTREKLCGAAPEPAGAIGRLVKAVVKRK